MEVAADPVENVCQLPPPGQPVAKARRHRAIKPKLVTRLDLDGRSNAAKQFDAITDALCVDLGGKDTLSAVELRLVESFAGASVMAEALNVQLLLGKQVDSAEFCQIASTLCRIGSRLGLKRRPRDVEEVTLARYLSDIEPPVDPEGE